ncbi:MAG TPA: sugar efflux transporter [Polyangiaceae bacterium]|nr:sugar efflux transporter [Polyangiaceae bacterium]
MSRLSRVLRVLRTTPGLLVVLFLSILLGLAYSFVVPFMSMFGTREVGMSHFGFGVFMTITSVSGIVISTLLARSSDTRWSRKNVLLLGGACGAVGYLGYAFVRNPLLLTIIGALALGVASITFGQVFAYSRDTLEHSSIERHEIPFYMNFIRLFFALAWTVGPAIAAYLMTHYSYRVTFSAAAFTYLLFCVLVALFVPWRPPSEASRQAALAMPLSVAFKNRQLLAHFLAFCLYFCCSTMGMMNLPLLILNELHGLERDVGVAYSLAPIFELPLMLYVGVLATRTPHEKIILGAIALGVVYYAGLSLAHAPIQVFLLQALSAAIVAVMSGVAITFFQNYLPNQAGTATNLYSTASRIGAVGGYLSFGVVGGELGHRAVFGLTVGLCLVALMILLMFRRPTAVLTSKSA